MHFGPKVYDKLKNKIVINYFENYTQQNGHNYIGARDSQTMNILQKNGIKSYFSGCATLLLKNINSNIDDINKFILIVDVEHEAMNQILKFIPKELHKKLIYISQRINVKLRGKHRMIRYDYSYNILQHISKSLFVITSRIHCALPSVSMNISVIFVNIGKLPGGKGKRTSGLLQIFHTVHSFQDIQKKLNPKNFDYFNPPTNPNYDIFIRFRSSLLYDIKQFSIDLYDNAVTFGVIPYKINKYYQKPYDIVFHQIYTIDLNLMTIQNKRSIESIFHHYPNAKINIFVKDYDHSHSIQDFLDLGFDISTIKYSLIDLLNKLQDIDIDEGFEKNNKFIKLCIIEFLTNYRSEPPEYNGPMLLTRIAKKNKNKVCGHCILNVVQKQVFQPIFDSKIEPICFKNKFNKTLYQNIINNTYSIHFNHKITSKYYKTKKGTLCNILFNKFCLFCSYVV